MSKTVRYKGTLTLIPKLDNETLEDQCKKIHDKSEGSVKLESYYYGYADWLQSNLDDYYIIYKDDLYKVQKEEMDAEFDIFNLNKLDNDKYGFDVMYYNGGCSFNEAIEESFKNYKKGEL